MNTHTNVVKTGLFALAVMAAAVLMLGVSRAKAAPPEAAPSQTAEATLGKQVNHQLVMLPWLGVFDNLQYTVDGDTVTLSGQVIEPYTKSDAEKAVKRIAGVAHVENQIHVLPVSLFDNGIRRAEYRAIFSDPSLGQYAMGAVPAIHIVVDNGHVTLEGAVSREMDRNIANVRALSVANAFSVTNNLRVN